MPVTCRAAAVGGHGAPVPDFPADAAAAAEPAAGDTFIARALSAARRVPPAEAALIGMRRQPCVEGFSGHSTCELSLPGC